MEVYTTGLCLFAYAEMWKNFTVLILEKHIHAHVKWFMLSLFLMLESHSLKPLNVSLWFLVFIKS